MKRRALLRELAKIAESKDLKLEFVRHGGSHDVYQIGRETFFVGRHADIPEQTALGTIKKARQV
jgi:hypothetical protein